MEARDYPKVEEVLRLLATAVNAARLYPPSSDLPGEALDRLVSRANEVTRDVGTLRLLVDPHAFRMGETPLCGTHTQTATLAEHLHAMQVGQLIVAPQLTRPEAEAFVSLAGSDPRDVRSAGGPRSALTSAGASTIAVIEVSLRASSEAGLAGVDLINAPLEEVARETVGAAARWYAAAGTNDAVDEAAVAVASLEQATRDLAMARVVEAMMRLTDDERVRVLVSALARNADGQRMRGMLDIIGRMSPATLARLLRLAAARCGATPSALAAPLELPAEVVREIGSLLAPSPLTEAECGVPADATADRLAAEAAVPGDDRELTRLKASAESTRAGKALAATVAVLRAHPSAESLQALGTALGPAARAGALVTVREALRVLDTFTSDAALAGEAEIAREALADPEVLAEVCAAVSTDADAAIAGELLAAAGTTGAEALLSHYMRAGESSRSLLRPAFRGMSELVAAMATRRLQSADTSTAIAILTVLPDLGERPALPVVMQALTHLDIEVRRVAVRALADLGGPDSRRALAKALGHWDPETRRLVVREVTRVQATEALPALIRILEDINVFERSHELKKEVIKCLEAIGSRDAVPVLERWSRRRFVIGRKSKELRFLARRAVRRLAAEGFVEKESMHRE